MRDAIFPSALSDEQFQAIEETLPPLPAGIGKERRTSERRSFPTIQLMAPYDGRTAPTQNDFGPVRCYDISRGGISFLWPEPPTFQHAVIGLESTLGRVWLKANVVRHLPIAGLRGEFLVCCRFLGRVECCW
jgi:hypothetical protein